MSKDCIVRLKDADGSGRYIGSGILYYEEAFGNKVYVLTAAHCLYKDCANFADLRTSVAVDIFKRENEYVSCTLNIINGDAVYGNSRATDFAVLSLERQFVKDALGHLPSVRIAAGHADAEEFLAMGYPAATNHQSLHRVRARCCGAMDNPGIFTLSVLDDLTADYAYGYSGGGLFAKIGDELYLTGIFSRFLAEERGRMIYGLSPDGLNNLLRVNKLEEIKLCYPAPGGMTPTVMARRLKDSIVNLGPSIDPNFNVPVRAIKAIYAVENRTDFIINVKTVVGNWLNEDYSRLRNETSNAIQTAYARFVSARKNVADMVNSCPFSIEEPLDIATLTTALKTAAKEINEQASELSGQLLYRCHSLANSCLDLLDNLAAEHIALSKTPLLLITGEAGCGKSHLMGFVAKNCLDSGLPAMLFHGRDFNYYDSIEDNMLRILGAKCSFEQFIESMDSIGHRTGRRILLLVDALNETEKNSFWRNRLPAFVEKMSTYKGVGLVMTIRSTYHRDTLPHGYDRDGSPFVVYQHNGFIGSEQQALEAFCKHYSLKAPEFPLLSAEYANPLFLHIACQVAAGDETKTILPENMHFDKIFIEYPHILDRRFDCLRDGEYDGLKVVSMSIRAIAEYLSEHSTHMIEYRECHRLLSEKVGQFRHLLPDLISDCLLSKTHRHEGSNDEYVRFTYQRLADYYKAEHMVEGCSNADDVKKRFAETDFISRFRNDYNSFGIVEQLAIILPERYGLEFWEVLPDGDSLLGTGPWEAPITFMNSLRWRSAASIAKEKCFKFLDEHKVVYDDWLETLLSVATIENHPFNADHFHSIMMRNSPMSMRDSVLQSFFLEKYNPEAGSDSAIRRLIDWAWTPGISRTLSSEPARLAAVALMWFLTATDIPLRDRSTKAIVNLLQYQPDALLSVMDMAVKIDDTYLRERMYAVAFACALRNGEPATVGRIARFVYDSFFKNTVQETHLLMRDYAACTIDYAHSLGLLEDVAPEEIHPPYGAKMPELPNHDQLKYHRLDDDENSQYHKAHNAIFNSLVDGLADFGNKIVKPYVNHFYACSFIQENELATLFPNHLNAGKSSYEKPLDHMGIRHWIIERVFSLGYDRDIHGDFDETVMTEYYTYYHSQHHGGRIERIGKKYQRIALMEILGCIADNYYFCGWWDKSEIYEGPWQGFYRDCDPVNLARTVEEGTKSWCRYGIRPNWNQDIEEWLSEFPNSSEICNAIERRDPEGRLWLTIYDSSNLNEPNKIGAGRYDVPRRFMNVYIMAYIVKSKEKDNIIRTLEKQDIFKLCTVDVHSEYSKTFLREKFWSRSSKYEKRDRDMNWKPFYKGCRFKYLCPIERISGNIEDDNSGTGRNGYMPAEFLMEMLQLQWASDDISFEDKNGTKVFTGHPAYSENSLIAADALLPALHSAGLDIVWTVYIEKMFFRKDFDIYGKIPVPSGVFYYDNNSAFAGRLNMFYR